MIETKDKLYLSRVIIEGVKPEIDCGRFPIKRVVGEEVIVEADIYADGHDIISAVLLFRKNNHSHWSETKMEPLVNDRWRGYFKVSEKGTYYYTIMGWIDKFKSWRHNLEKKAGVGQQISNELLIGVQLIDKACQQASAKDKKLLYDWQCILESNKNGEAAKIDVALSENVSALMEKYSDRSVASVYHKELVVTVERKKARFSAWYEMFPRSTSAEANTHGTFKDCEARIPYISSMGFDVIYLPPIHPLGHTNKKGRNNALTAETKDPGTPWAIGAEEGGHKAIYHKLGSLADFRKFVAKAKEHDIEIALDIAFQCSPDHPYVNEHPEWFKWRPDGTIQYAENPPKKYQDIYPLNFESENRWGLWQELKSIFIFWLKQGVSIFRVDNPHTKPLPFWEWVIAEIKKEYPEVIFLSEAFTRPKIMYRLAKLGFTQSYTYFTWRNTKWELIDYFTELTKSEVSEFFIPNIWTNTPDILHEYLQHGGRPAFMIRFVLAATLGPNYGIYGPVFELCEATPRERGSEEYLNSEKYELKCWNIDSPHSLRHFIAKVNKIRYQNQALHSNKKLEFHNVDNPLLICYSKRTEDYSNIILTVVNLDPHYTQSGWVELPLGNLRINEHQPFQVHDLLNNVHYTWNGHRNFVELNPHTCPAHIFRIY